MNFPQGRPSEVSNDGDFARHLATLLGPAYQAQDGTNNAADFLALGGAMADVRAILQDIVAEMFVNTAYDLLSELEADYGLPVHPELAASERQANLLAKVRAARGGTPQRLLTALSVVAPEATITENDVTTVPREPDGATYQSASRGVFLFAVTVAVATWNNAAKRAQLVALLDAMKPAHTAYNIVTRVGFRTDDVQSLTDRDALGV
jgi:uncharacterized protein YmfQ (DUF2313 family)